MISRSGSGNFFAAHYDWIAVAVGGAALAAGAAVFALSLGADPDASASETKAEIDRIKPMRPA